MDYDEIDYYDYDLPQFAIAQSPSGVRSEARLLDGRGGIFVDRSVRDLPGLLEPGDVVVVNDTKVIKGRIRLARASGGMCEVLLLEEEGGGRWSALLRPSSKLRPGDTLRHDGHEVLRIVDEFDAEGGPSTPRKIQILDFDLVEELGVMPLPPYIKSELADPERYQTVYARHEGSVAAPTAGLHLDDLVFAAFESRQIRVATVTLSVGLGTFRPVTAQHLDDHRMHEERYHVSDEAWEMISKAQRVVSVGTTVLRTLETVAKTGELEGRTDLFIRPGFQIEVVDLLLTNFHTPRSTLLVLLESFYGPRWREMYAHALDRSYRFLSFGDATLVDRNGGAA